jgi:hypothetical protein
MDDEMSERLGEGLVGHAQVLVAPPVEDTDPAFARLARQSAAERGLADSRFTREEDDAPLAFDALFEVFEELLPLALTANELKDGTTRELEPVRQRDPGCGRCRCPFDLEQQDRFGDSLELTLTDFDETMRASPTGHRTYDVAGQDLAALTDCAHPSRLHHGITEVVVLFDAGFAATQADS